MTKHNQVILTGHLGAKPKNITKGEDLFTSFSMATQESYKDAQGEWQNTKTIWHQVLVFNEDTIKSADALDKGSLVKVFGALHYKSFDVVSDDGKTFKKWAASVIAHKIELGPFDDASNS